MKQLLYILLIALVSTACNSNDQEYDFPVNSEKLHTVKFNIANPYFDIDKQGLKSTGLDEKMLLRMFIYRDTASYENITNYKLDTLYLNKPFDTTIELLAGSYRVGFVATKRLSYLILADFYNYFKDYYLDGNAAYYPNSENFDNGNVFYYDLALVVSDNQTEQTQNVELNPMWSYLHINIADANTFDVPAGTNALEFEIQPRYCGFGMANKLATLPYIKDESIDIISLDSIRQNPTFTYTAALSETEGDNDITISVNYLKKDADSTTVLENRPLKIPQTTLKNGYVYNINGKLGSESSGQSMNITLGEFNKEDVVIEF